MTVGVSLNRRQNRFQVAVIMFKCISRSTRIFSRSLCRLPPPPLIDYTVSHWFPAPSPNMSNPPPPLNPTFDDENPFPSLPLINDDDIRTKVFTHRSFYARPNHVFEDHPDDPSPDNEK